MSDAPTVNTSQRRWNLAMIPGDVSVPASVLASLLAAAEEVQRINDAHERPDAGLDVAIVLGHYCANVAKAVSVLTGKDVRHTS